MSYIKLKTPEGYFEKSLGKTMDSARNIDRRRRTVLCFCAALVLSFGTYFSIHAVRVTRDGKEYLAQQEELARLDIFLEIN